MTIGLVLGRAPLRKTAAAIKFVTLRRFPRQREDIPLLAAYFLKEIAPRYGRGPTTLSAHTYG
ncbi:MAG TPA: hypothetical protein VGX03_17325, partial [Candidatus Binatia bacterium]|nr:hypothetical protein [Candidatus Binatia bacterium]